MELIAIIAIAAFVIWLVTKWKDSSTAKPSRSVPPVQPTPTVGFQREQIVTCPRCGQRNRLREADAPSQFRCGSCRTELPNPFTAPPPKAEPIPTFRPSASRSSHDTAVSFRDTTGDGNAVTTGDLSGLVDAFTGEALNAALGLYQCGNRKCGVYYHRSSFEVIRSENNGQCVACLSASIRTISTTAAQSKSWQNVSFEPDVITLDNYRGHVGRVITFEGIVRKVLKSRSGRDYAVMFEDKDWSDGLKMVVFRGKITAVGGGDFLRGLRGRTIRVRGLLQKHRIFGYQIAVSERRMIQV